MGAAIPTLLEYAIPAPPGQFVSMPGVEFSRDPLTLVVAEPALVLNWREWFAWHQADFGLGGLLVSLAALIVLWRRRPRGSARAGTWCCRGCEHELSAPQITVESERSARWSGEEAKCPECGRRDVRGPMRVGRARAWWGAGMAIAAAGLIGGGAAIVLSLELGLRTGQFGETWPVAGLEAIIPSWPSKRVDDRPHWGVRFVRVDLATGKRRDLGTAPDLPFPRRYLSPDGRYVVVATRQGVLLIHIASGTRRVAEIPALKDRSNVRAGVRGFAADGREIYLVRSHDAEGRRVDELFSVEMATGRLRAIAVVELELPEEEKVARSLRTDFAFSGSGERLRWVHHSGVPGTRGMTFRWEEKGERRDRREDINLDAVSIRLTEDGKCCVFEPMMLSRPRGFALSDGSKITDPPSPTSKVEQPRLYLLPDGDGNLLVRDTSFFGFSRGTLRANLGSWPCYALSPGDRYAVAIGDEEIPRAWPLASLGLKPLQGWKVRVWDLKPMLDQRFGGKRATAVEKK